MAVNLGSSAPEYYRGYENGKQESAARIRELEAENAKLNTAIASWKKEEEVWRRAEANLGAALAAKDAALAAADKALKPFAKCMCPFTVWADPDVVNEHTLRIRSWGDIFKTAYDARALIAKAKEEKA